MLLYKSCHKTAGIWGIWHINEKSKVFRFYYWQSTTGQREGFGKMQAAEQVRRALLPQGTPHTWLWSVGEGLHVVRSASVGHHVNSHRDSWGDLLVVIWWHLHNKVILQGKRITFSYYWSEFSLLTSKDTNRLIKHHKQKPRALGAMHMWDTPLMALSWHHLQPNSP